MTGGKIQISATTQTILAEIGGFIMEKRVDLKVEVKPDTIHTFKKNFLLLKLLISKWR